jgi:hypothetical protein
MLPSSLVILLLAVAAPLALGHQMREAPFASSNRILVEDFMSDRPGDVPRRWKILDGRQLVPVVPAQWNERRSFRVVRENNRQFVRAQTQNGVARIIMPNDGDALVWNFEDHPKISWEWRAVQLPEGAREDRVNDTGGAVYVTFDMDWLGRPRSIKYTYSSTLPVGTVVNFGRLKVIVVSSGADGIGDWIRIERDVVSDFRRVFRGDPPSQPLSIALWSDTDDTRSSAQVDFDNIILRR